MTGDAAASLDPRSARALVFVADVGRPELSPEDDHHLRRVLRLRDGAAVVASDGHGRWRACRLGAALEPVGEVVADQPPTPRLTVAFSTPKGERLEVAVQKLTELGVDRIVLLRTDRTVVRWEGTKAARHLERLARVAREAAMQCRRVHLPEVAGPVPYAEAATWPQAARCDVTGTPLTLASPTVLVGPEGGWTDAERQVPVPTVALAAHVLRVETAAITAGALLGALRAGLVRT